MNCIKNSLFYFLIPLLFISHLHPHSGRIDASGGHKDNINGSYHYHNKPSKIITVHKSITRI